MRGASAGWVGPAGHSFAQEPNVPISGEPGSELKSLSDDDRIALGAQSFGHRAALLHAGLRGGKIDVRAGEDDRICIAELHFGQQQCTGLFIPVRFGKHGLFRADTGP